MLMMKFCTVTVKPVFALGEYDDDDDDGYDGDDESSHGKSESSVFAPRELCKGRDRTGGTCGRLWSSLREVARLNGPGAQSHAVFLLPLGASYHGASV